MASTPKKITTGSPTALFNSFLALLVWVPLPLASNRPWAWAIMEIWVYIIFIFWLWLWFRNRVTPTTVFRKSRIILWIWVGWLIFGMLQILPIPIAWLETLSPAVAQLYKDTNLIVGPQSSQLATLSLDPSASIESWFKSLSYGLIFILLLMLVDSRRRLRILIYTILFSALFQSVYGSLMAMSGLEFGFLHKKLSYLGVATGTFVNRNHLAAYLVMALSMGIGLMIANLNQTQSALPLRQRIRNAVALMFSAKLRLRIYLAILVVGLVLTHSRMGNTAFFCSLFISGIIALALSRHATRSTVILLISLVVIDLFIVGAWFGLDKVVHRLETTSMAREARDEITQYGFEIIKDYPVFGSGMGSFYTTFPRYRRGDIQNFYDHAHNDYLQFAAEAGGIGIALLSAMVACSLGCALLALIRRRDPLMRGIAFSSTMGTIAILIHASVEFNLQIPANAATFMIVLGLGWISLFFDRQGNSEG